MVILGRNDQTQNEPSSSSSSSSSSDEDIDDQYENSIFSQTGLRKYGLDKVSAYISVAIIL